MALRYGACLTCYYFAGNYVWCVLATVHVMYQFLSMYFVNATIVVFGKSVSNMLMGIKLPVLPVTILYSQTVVF